MTWAVYLLFGLLAVVTAYLIYEARPVVRFRGMMLVICPETREPAAVKIASWRAAVEAVV